MIDILVKLLIGPRTGSTTETHFTHRDAATQYAMMNPGNYGCFLLRSKDSEEDLKIERRKFLTACSQFKYTGAVLRDNPQPVRGQLGSDKVADITVLEDDIDNQAHEMYIFVGFGSASPEPKMIHQAQTIGKAFSLALAYPGMGFWTAYARCDDEEKLLREWENKVQTVLRISNHQDRLKAIKDLFGWNPRKGLKTLKMPKGTVFKYGDPNPADENGIDLSSTVVGPPTGDFHEVDTDRLAFKSACLNPGVTYFWEGSPKEFNTTFTLKEWTTSVLAFRTSEARRNIKHYHRCTVEPNSWRVGFCCGDGSLTDCTQHPYAASPEDAMTLAIRKPGYVFFCDMTKPLEDHSSEFEAFTPKEGAIHSFQMPKNGIRPHILIFRKEEIFHRYVGFQVGDWNGDAFETTGSHGEAMQAALTSPGTCYVCRVTSTNWSLSEKFLQDCFEKLSRHFNPTVIPNYALKRHEGVYQLFKLPGSKMTHKFVIGLRPLQSDRAHVLKGDWKLAVGMAIQNPGHCYMVEIDVTSKDISKKVNEIQKALADAITAGHHDCVPQMVNLDGEVLIDVNEMIVVTVGELVPAKTAGVPTNPTHTSFKTNSEEFNVEDMSVTAATGAQRSRDADDYAYHLHHPLMMEKLGLAIASSEDEWRNSYTIIERLDQALGFIFKWLGGHDNDEWLASAAIATMLVMDSEESGEPARLDPKLFDMADSWECGLILLPPRAMARVSKVWRTGANRYGTYNYERGMLAVECLNHGIKHIYDYVSKTLYNKETGCDDLAHVVCNLFMATQSWEFHPELNRGTRRGEGSTLTSDIIAKQEAFNFLKRHRADFDRSWVEFKTRTNSDPLQMTGLYCQSLHIDSGTGVKEAVRTRLFEESRIK